MTTTQNNNKVTSKSPTAEQRPFISRRLDNDQRTRSVEIKYNNICNKYICTVHNLIDISYDGERKIAFDLFQRLCICETSDRFARINRSAGSHTCIQRLVPIPQCSCLK